MSESRSSYRQIFKATSVFGGTQVLVILIGMIKTKFVAVLLGTKGVGILGLYNAPLTLITHLTGLGLNYSAVREVSKAVSEGDSEILARRVAIAKRWILFSGILGFVLVLALSPWLSRWTFGDYTYLAGFAFLSITLLFNSFNVINRLLLQSFRMISKMGKALIIGAVLGLMTSVPLYYFFGLKGIVASIIISSISTSVISFFFAKQIPINASAVTVKEAYKEGLPMARLGMAMMLAGIGESFSNYLLITYVSNMGGIEQVGLYNMGWNIVGQYIGFVFAAMTTDYFPRLAAVSGDSLKLRELICQQAEMTILILAPLLILLMVIMPYIIQLFYTKDFIAAISFVNWLTMGIILKGVSWAIGYIFTAKGDTETFLWIEVIGSVFFLSCNIAGYTLYGLTGLGISYLINYLFGISLTYIVAVIKYQFKFSLNFIKIFFVMAIFTVAGFAITNYQTEKARLLGTSIILMLSLIYSAIEMNKRMDLMSLIVGIKDRFLK